VVAGGEAAGGAVRGVGGGRLARPETWAGAMPFVTTHRGGVPPEGDLRWVRGRRHNDGNNVSGVFVRQRMSFHSRLGWNASGGDLPPRAVRVVPLLSLAQRSRYFKLESRRQKTFEGELRAFQIRIFECVGGKKMRGPFHGSALSCLPPPSDL